MSRHDQRTNKRNITCPNCKAGTCESCVDRLRSLYGKDPICACERKFHVDRINGEPTKGIVDPETGDIYAHKVIVKTDGSVVFPEELN